MHIKKFKGVNIKEALKKVKEEFGDDAVILSTQSIPNGDDVAGISNRPLVEITAAMDREISVNKTTPLPPLIRGNRVGYSPLSKGELKGVVSSTKGESGYSPLIKGDTGGCLGDDNKQLVNMIADIADIKEELHSLSRDMKRDKLNMAKPFATPNIIWKTVSGVNDNIKKLEGAMGENEIYDRFSANIIEELKDELKSDNTADYSRVKNMCIEKLKWMFNINNIPEMCGSGKMIAALIGPTGTGKTTTIAKLAAKFKMKMNKNIGLITIDTYRIKAVEQLKVYAEIMNIPLEVASSRDELKRALSLFKDKDIVFIDTAGRSYKNKDHMDDLVSMLDTEPSIKKHLVVSATTGTKTMTDTINEFNRFSIDSIIYSKIDEGRFFGNIFNNSIIFNIPVSYITTGQGVPDDIEQATNKRLAELVMGEN